MRRTSLSIAVVACVALAGSAARAEEDRSEIPAGYVLSRFKVAKHGDALVIPVVIAGKEHPFIVDTGATMTAFDVKLSKGQAGISVPFESSEGVGEFKIIKAPPATVGGLPLGLTDVGVLDLGPLNEVSGVPIEGILGIDILSRHVTHLNFDRGELLFLGSVPQNSGEVIPIEGDPGEHPRVVTWVSGQSKLSFLIDTGSVGFDSGSIHKDQWKSLVSFGQYRKVGSVHARTLTGSGSRQVYQGTVFPLGGMTIKNPVFSDSRSFSKLGLGFLSRFVVTLDLPGKKLYLKKGEAYARADRWNATGLHALKKKNGVVFETVDEGSPGALAGIRAGDRLIELDGKRADQVSLFEIHSRLAENTKMTCVVMRDGKRLEFKVPAARR